MLSAPFIHVTEVFGPILSLFNHLFEISKKKHFKVPNALKCIILKQISYKFPLKACSLSIDSKRALKLPFPKDFAPFLCMIS